MPSETIHIAANGKSFYLSVRSDTTQNLEENIDRTFFDINCSNNFFGYVSLSKGNKSRNKKMGPT